MNTQFNGFVPIQIVEDKDNTDTCKMVRLIDAWRDLMFWSFNIQPASILTKAKALDDLVEWMDTNKRAFTVSHGCNSMIGRHKPIVTVESTRDKIKKLLEGLQ